VKTLAEYGKKFLELGVNIVGGCCGTNAAHIKGLREIADSRKRKVESRM
jgi:methionine synthase I (cobalamin-dependent)